MYHGEELLKKLEEKAKNFRSRVGRSIIALSENIEAAKKILEEGIKGGAKRGWITKVDTGVRKEH
ncbi:MAG: hypothetical protein H5T50_01330 [Nitrososphaeria archaeon]|nr:hypothetical protein [Nitrososphaeria archaeon]